MSRAAPLAQSAALTASDRTRFSRELYLTVWAVAEALFCGHQGPPPAERLRWLCDETMDFLEHAGTRPRLMLRASFFIINTFSPLLAWRLPPFRMLARTTRVRALARFERSPLAMTLLAVKATLCIIYYEHPDAAQEIGFDARPLAESP